ncbi:hypothetical protein CC79DRAFT_1391107 [Sarocladium strictum]
MDSAREESPAQDAFKRAQEAFRKRVSNLRQYDATLRTTKVGDVYDAARKIQEDLAGHGQLKHLSRIEPFLRRLTEYASVIEVFVSAKPEVLALIWGPIKLMLLWTCKLQDVMNEIASAMESIGHALPHFKRSMETFPTSEEIKTALALFYEDILDFHATILNFLQHSKNLSKQLKLLWSRPQKKLEMIISNIKKHQLLLNEEVTFVHIQQAKDARDRDLAHFNNIHADELSRKYVALKASINPLLFNDWLDRLYTTSVAGCDAWLLSEAQFLKWADHGLKKSDFLWLHGIPGAGKTYLVASIVRYTKELTVNEGHTLFAFLSYTEKARLSARAILLSLLFQAADRDFDLQSVLIQTSEREIQESASQTSTLLQSLLAAAPGVTYIVIDGLDEIDEHERQVLLQRLDEMLQGCENLRLLLSCRKEHDIAPILTEKTVGIRVNDMNSGSIQKYIDHRFEDWMSKSQFSTEIQAELNELIAPLSAKASGMFLYARVLLDSLEYMSSVDEVRDELKVYPKDMNDAYHRIFNRINKAPWRHRDRGRKVLGWTGCAPVPMTTFELEQALAVSQAVAASNWRLPRHLVHTDFLKLCGPIIEIFNDRVQFVHFTAQEYVFDAEIPDFIHESHAKEDLAASLVAYLSMDVLDLDLGDDEIKENILNGTYRLFEYAYLYWPTMLGQLGPQIRSTSVKSALDRLVLDKETNQVPHDKMEGLHLSYMNPDLERSQPAVFRVLCDIFRFYLSEKTLDRNRSKSDSWVKSDPLLTSQMLVRVQGCLEILAADATHQQKLQSHYGKGLHKCTFPFCQCAHRGFETIEDAREHLKIHGKPWKCTIPNCDFSSIGFSSKFRRDEHWMKLHLSAQRHLAADNFNPEQLDVNEAQSVLFILVLEGNAAAVAQLLAAPGGKCLKDEVIASARKIAAKRGDSQTTRVLAPARESLWPKEIIANAVKSGNVDFAREAIAESCHPDFAWLMRSILRTESDDIWVIWEEYIVSSVGGRRTDSVFYNSLFKALLFESVKNGSREETRLARVLSQVSHERDPDLLGASLVRVAKTSCSVTIAKVLVDRGASIDYVSSKGRTGMTALHAAAKKISQDAAYFMEYLIREGAAGLEKTYPPFHDPKDIGKERGAMAIVTHVGRTFEELREKSWSDRGCPSKHKRTKIS